MQILYLFGVLLMTFDLLTCVHSQGMFQHSSGLASFPGLPLFFVLRFAFSTIYGSGRAVNDGKGLGTPISLVDARWMWGGVVPGLNLCAVNHRVSFSLVKSSTVDLVNVWCPIIGALNDEV